MLNLNLKKDEEFTITPPFYVKLFISLMLTLLFIETGSSQIKVQADGKIGIGTSTPTKDLEIDASEILIKNGSSSHNLKIQYYYGQSIMLEPTVNNTGYLGHNNFWYQLKARNIHYYYEYDYSDIKIKEDIKVLNGSLDKVLLMQGIQYKLKPEYSTSQEFSLKTDKRKTNIGFVAQDIMAIAPEVVDYDTAVGLYAISYSRIIPLLVEAIKEQNQEIAELKRTVAKKDSDEKSSPEDATTTDNPPYLGKNAPNPFGESTVIDYYLPESIAEAILTLSDLQGKQIRSIPIVSREYGSVTIQAGDLQPGIYHYALIADGELIGMEKMILTE